MSTLIPERQWDKIRTLTAEEIEGIHACEVFSGKKYLFTIIPVNTRDYVISDNIRTKAEYLGQICNSVLPPEPSLEHTEPFLTAVIGEKGDDITIEAVFSIPLCPDCGFVAQSSFGLMAHQRKHAREKKYAGVSA